jgi:hypothetical protein
MKDADLRRCGLHVELALMVSMFLWPCIMFGLYVLLPWTCIMNYRFVLWTMEYIYMYVMALAYRVTTMVLIDLVMYLFILKYTVDICI